MLAAGWVTPASAATKSESLTVQTHDGKIAEWNVAKAYPGCPGGPCSVVRLHWAGGQTSVTLPVVGGPRRAGALFGR